MRTFIRDIALMTTAESELIDITDRVIRVLKESEIKNGLLTVATRHTTSAVFLNENEAGLQKDMLKFLKGLASKGAGYLHDRNPLDGRINAHAHLQSLLLPASQSVIVQEGKLLLGSWQRIFFAELDGPRPKRQITVQVLGE